MRPESDEFTPDLLCLRSQLNKCMAQFMNTKLKFSDLNRLQRISCTKELRTQMEERMGELLQSELQKSLDNIAGAETEE